MSDTSDHGEKAVHPVIQPEGAMTDPEGFDPQASTSETTVGAPSDPKEDAPAALDADPDSDSPNASSLDPPARDDGEPAERLDVIEGASADERPRIEPETEAAQVDENPADEGQHPATQTQAAMDIEEHGPPMDDEEGFDPATLANLAALSRIINEDEDEADLEDREDAPAEEPLEGDPAQDDALETDSNRHEGPLTREQVQEFVNNLSHGRDKKDEGMEDGAKRETESVGGDDRQSRAGSVLRDVNEMDLGEEGEEGEDDARRRKGDDEDYEDGKPSADGGKGQRRKRNRTVLSCTECHRRCDRNIPCSRCIKRGVPGMCRMEHPVLPQRKRRKMQDDEDINYELGLRVQALETLLRSGSLMDADQASAAARETIMHATRAANAGSMDANNALAQLTQSVAAGGGIGGMTQDAQSSLLLDVLQQLTAASMGRPLNNNGSGESGGRRGLELWSTVPTASQDTVLAVTSAYEADEVPTKINLSLPGFREDNGKIFVPPTVRYVEKNLRNENILSREALPIGGHAPFLDVGTKFAYGAESQAYRHKRIAAIQAISLTGALRLAGTFLARFPNSPGAKTVFVPSPTADEDTTALQDAGLEIRSFRYLDPKTGSVDWESLREDLQDAPVKSVVLLQERELIPLVMMAFQGLSTGDTNRDAQALRFMVHEGLPVVLVQSFDAMMGLYADSPSIVSVVTQNAEDRDRVDSQLRSVARGMWFHPSPWGAQVAHQLLSDQRLYPAWLAEIKAMSDRLRSVREKLYDLLTNKLKTPGSWFHLKRASGMYCTALLGPSQAEALTTKRHVHLLPDGCFNLGCLNATKIDVLARAIDHVVREGIREAEEQQAQRLAMELALAAAKEQQAREEAEAQAAAEAAEALAAREEDTLLMERSIANAIEAQQRAEEDESRREAERKVMDEAQRKALERAEIARQAEAILATIS